MIPVWCEIICNQCNKFGAGQFTIYKLPKRQLQEDAKKDGFLMTPEGPFCCKECYEQWMGSKHESIKLHK